MSQRKIKVIGVFAVASASILGMADPTTNAPPRRLTVVDVARLVGEQNPRVLAERETIAAAKAERLVAAAYPNPKLTTDHLQPGNGERTIFSGDRQEQITVELPILIPGQRSSRIAKADAEIAAAQARFAAGTGILAGDAFLAFMRLLGLQERAGVLSNAVMDVTRLKETVAGRAEQGAASSYDLARIEIEFGIVRSRLEGAQSEIAAGASQLASLLNLTNGLPVADGAFQPWNLPEQILYDFTSGIQANPLAAAAAKEVAAADAAVEAAKKNRWPDLSVSGGRTWTRHPFGAADYIGVNVEIPIFDTRRGQLEKAKSEARTAEARRNTVLAETEASIRQLAETVQRRSAALDRYRTNIEPRLALLKQMSADAYALGRHTLLESLDAEQARREVTLEHIETVSALIEAQIRFLTAIGQLHRFIIPPNPPSNTP